MNFTKQNNPVVIGILVVVLGGALYGVFLQIKHVRAAMAADDAAHKPVTAAAPAPASTPTTQRAVLTAYTRPAFSHDPFQQPVADYSRQPAAPVDIVHMPILPSTNQRGANPIQSTSSERLRVVPLPVSGPTKSSPLATQTTTAASTAGHTDVKSFRVSAILKGPATTAIIERDGHAPVPVGVGAEIGGYRVDRIGSDGVVLSDSSGIYTVSMASDAGGQAGIPTQETVNVAH